MPEGFEGIRQASAEIQARRESGGGDFERKLKLQDGDTARVRFLEPNEGDPVKWAWCHEVPAIGKQKWGDSIPCLDQRGKGEVDCPACASEDNDVRKRKFKGYINLIWRDAPVFKEDSEGKKDWNTIVGTADQIAVWEFGITVAEELDAINAKYGGLPSRDFEVTRKGEKLNTRYSIQPADPDAGRVAMSSADDELAGQKYDLKKKITPPSADVMAKRARGESTNTGGEKPHASADPQENNVFLAGANS
jgi:hypothetical protein